MRRVRAALLGSYTTTQLGRLLLSLAADRGIELELYEGAFGQYAQELLDPASGLHSFQPQVVILALHEGALQLPDLSSDPEAALEAELARWRQLWSAAEHAGARIVQHTFAVPAIQPFGHLAGRLASRRTLTLALNARLMRDAPPTVAFVDCDLLSSLHGKLTWFDDRYWYLARQAVSPEALPILADQTLAVLAAAVGLSRKCIVLDLDGTLWGGVIGEVGLAGIELGSGPSGEAYSDFQTYLLGLKNKGILLAVVSKNNESEARLPFDRHPDMRLRLEDFAAFIVNWNDKAGNIRALADQLELGLDSLVFIDDNPAERALVRELLPEVDVIDLPPDPAGYARALAAYSGLETAAITQEDRDRTDQYRARAAAREFAARASNLEEFLSGLEMSAMTAPFDEFHLPRIAQLISKTNQFNLTGRRRGLPELRALIDSQEYLHLFLKLRDRFGDHGLVSSVIAHIEGDAAVIDTFVMSCRVIGRTVEAELLAQLGQAAAARGCRFLRGTFVPSGRNQLVKDLYARFGFERVSEEDGVTSWQYDLDSGPIESRFIGRWQELEPATAR
jgi:FkbH-like protein